MSKFHITKNGKTAKCRAFIKACPLGEHYDTKEQAETAAQKNMSNEYGVLSEVPTDEKLELKAKYDEQYKLLKTNKFKSRKDEEFERTRLARLSRRMKNHNSEVTNLKDILKDIRKPDGGATISISMTNNQKAIVPTSGFCASPYPQYSKVFNTSKEVNHTSILKFIDEIDNEGRDILSQEDTYIGLWNDPDTGKVYLDISKRYNEAEEARIACEQNDQIAYFDLQMLESVDVDRKAKSGH